MTQLVREGDARRVAVLGAGTMGHGIAQVAALSGLSVSLYDVDDGALARALESIRAHLDKGVELGKVAPDAPGPALARTSVTTDLAAAVAEADVVIEAVPESLDLKHETFRGVAAAAPGRALLATNTSSLSVAAIARALPDPGRLVGMHFFNPVHIMKLVEVIRHEGSDEGAVALAGALADRFGKTAIVVRDVPGFASSRLGLAIGLEAMRMVEQGVAAAADVDTAMRLGYGHPMGPLELTDLVGLDTRLKIADYLASELGEVFRAPAILRDKVEAGDLGKKTGQGFYRWDGGNKVE